MLAKLKLLTLFNKIEIELDKATFSPGQLVCGRVIVKTSDSSACKEVKLTFTGCAFVKWAEREFVAEDVGVDGCWLCQDKVSTLLEYSSAEHYFTFERYLYGGESKKGEMFDGVTSLPFTFRLPKHLPSTFEGQCGKVEYLLEATAKRPNDWDLFARKAVEIKQVVDLNDDRAIGEPLHSILTVDLPPSRFFKGGSLELCLRANKRGFCPDEMVPFLLEIHNKSCSSVKDVSVMLVKRIIYRVPSKTSQNDNYLVKLKRGEGVPKWERGQWKFCIKFSQVPPTNLGTCKIISIQYSLVVTPYMCFYSRDRVRRSFPIIIGTVPVNQWIINKHVWTLPFS